MHPSAMFYAEKFFHSYKKIPDKAKILEIGSQNVNGTLRDLKPIGSDYIGIDFVDGIGVDKVIDDPYNLPFENDSFDVVLCSSVLEHSEFFWLLIVEMIRVLKPGGLLYINAPSNGYIHRYPVDSWRFYPDAGKSMIAWCKKNGINSILLESFFGEKKYQTIDRDAWIDFVCVICKGEEDKYSNQRILNSIQKYSNAYVLKDGYELSLNQESMPPDYLEINHLHKHIEFINEEMNFVKAKLSDAELKYEKIINTKYWKIKLILEKIFSKRIN